MTLLELFIPDSHTLEGFWMMRKVLPEHPVLYPNFLDQHGRPGVTEYASL